MLRPVWTAPNWIRQRGFAVDAEVSGGDPLNLSLAEFSVAQSW